MWPFNRRKKVDLDISEETREDYQTEHHERLGLAWLIAFGTLMVTMAVVVGLSFGGRWAYRKIVHKDKKAGISQIVGDNQPATLPGVPSGNSSLDGQNQPGVKPTTPSNQSQTPNSTLSRTGPEGDD